MHILLIVNHYPSKDGIHLGVKYREQVKQYLEHGYTISILAPFQRETSSFSNIISGKALYSAQREKGTHIIRDHTHYICHKTKLTGALNALNVNFNYLYASTATRLYRKIANNVGTPDLIHAHASHWSGVVGYLLSHKYDIPYVLTENMTIYETGRYEERNYKLMQNVFAHAQYTLPVSKSLGHILEDTFGTAVRPWQAVPNMQDASLFHPPQTENHKDHFVFFSVGRFVENKRYDLLLHALAKLTQAYPNIELRLGGFGPKEQELRELAKSLRVEMHVTFLGKLTREQVAEEMRYCDAYVLSSDYETFGIPLVEAGLSGKPMVATRSAGPDEIVQKNVGILVGAGSSRELRKGMSTMIEQIDQFVQEEIRQHFAQRYSGAGVMRQLNSIYASTLKTMPE